MNIIKYLRDRELISQITNEYEITKILEKEKIAIYCGFDPTSDSLHIGHLMPILCLKHFQLQGHKPIIVIGGATSLIGDPSFKINNRKINNLNTIKKWSDKIKSQLSLLLDFNCGYNSAIIINNYNWFKDVKILPFLQNIGKNVSINKIINKDALKQRIGKFSKGLSFSEFSYNLFQSYDFVFLNKKYNVKLQIGGSDQWGNITSGIDLTKKINNNCVYGLTVPLMTKTDGTKFSKSGLNTIWLDSKKTTPFDFYQFWIKTSDDNVFKFIKCMTFINSKQIKLLYKESLNNKNQCIAQTFLAKEITKFIHGVNNLCYVKYITEILFKRNLKKLTQTEFDKLIKYGIKYVKIKNDSNLIMALIQSKLSKSISQAKKMIISNAIKINGDTQIYTNYKFEIKDKLYNKYTILCKGKKNFCLLYWK
ncbi:MAG: tyrosine--tRNA ligase [Enterobacterales bacterium]